MDDAVGIDLRAIRNRFETEIRLEVVAACSYPPSEASCEAGAMRGEVTPYRRGHGVPGGHALPAGTRHARRSSHTKYSTYNRIGLMIAIAIRL